MSNRALVYRTAPNAEHKALQEFREAGIRAYVPRDRGGKRSPFTKCRPTPAPRYVFPERALASAYAKHVKGAPLGWVDKADLRRLYIDKPRAPPKLHCRYVIGQSVWVGDVPGVIAGIEAPACKVVTMMLGKQHVQTLHYSRLRPG